jgi:hypothetical protein
MGIKQGNLSDFEAAYTLLKNKVKDVQQSISTGIEMFLINEILYEGGFNPYLKEEDEVKLVFQEIDPSVRRKEDNHQADLFAKNAISHDTLLRNTRQNSKQVKGQFAFNLLNKQEAPPSNPKPVTARRKESLELILKNLDYPSRVEEVDKFLEDFSNTIDLDLTRYTQSFQELHQDVHAFTELIYLLAEDNVQPSNERG